MNKKQENHVPNVSGSFQIVENERKEEIEEVTNDEKLDKESMYYARQFMED
ncbi:hypothetical protein LCL95_01570 [Bacillus timonensis]|nr:hypothetical protein [Bacillus timonensis]